MQVQTHLCRKGPILVDGYPLAEKARHDVRDVHGRGGGCFANDSKRWLSSVSQHLLSVSVVCPSSCHQSQLYAPPDTRLIRT